MQFKRFYWLIAIMVYEPIYHNLQNYMVSVRISLNLKRSSIIFPQETMGASESRFAPELNEKEVIDLNY